MAFMSEIESRCWEQRSEAASFERDRAADMKRPSYMLRPELSKDGDKWIALYGDNLVVGVVGCGDTPEAAFADFDRAWVSK